MGVSSPYLDSGFGSLQEPRRLVREADWIVRKVVADSTPNEYCDRDNVGPTIWITR